jgi:hypothetical protein
MSVEKGPNDFLRLGDWLQEGDRFREIARMLDAAGRKRIIFDRETNKPYLARYYYQSYRPYCRVVIHNVLKSDVAGLHDHPWPASTYILSGGYWESKLINENADPSSISQESNIEKVWRGPGYHGEFKSDHYHRLELDPDKAGTSTWTLFMMGPKEKDWGFLGEDGKWVQHEEYIENLSGKAK